MPAMPNPGITKISSAINAMPAMNKIISTMDASSSIYDEPKNKASAINPAVPGTPQPGVLISAIKPKKPIIIKIVEIIGLLRNLTTSSAQFDFTETISAPLRLNTVSTSFKLSTVVSAISYLIASDVVSVIRVVLSSRPSTTILSSTIPCAISVLLPLRSAVDRISDLMYD